MSEATFCRWKKRHAGMGVAEVRRLQQLEEGEPRSAIGSRVARRGAIGPSPTGDGERKPKRLVADLSLDRSMLRGMACTETW